ncbi:hypothetical protein G3I66_14855 [Streptomyces rubrogriseus]|uniref:Uncharacterized protein n=1 Tax=Streptomyces rubrogriseus TaxID=194673 RepID=A0A6G3TDR1_9ACTN|nr:hypothetical protein [Streptomyces rubrogriseus]
MDDGLLAELVARAQAGGVKLTGEGGLENYRYGHRPKMVITWSGPVKIAVPRDRVGLFEPQLVKAAAAVGRGGRDGPVAVGEGAAAWGDLRASGRDLRRGDLQVDDLHAEASGGTASYRHRPPSY